MRNYLRLLKPLDEYNFIKIKKIDIPEEVLRLLRVQYGIAFLMSDDSIYFWKIGHRVCLILSKLESFSGKYKVGKDAIGYYYK